MGNFETTLGCCERREKDIHPTPRSARTPRITYQPLSLKTESEGNNEVPSSKSMRQAAWHYADMSLHHSYHYKYPDEPEAWTAFIRYTWWKRCGEMVLVMLLALTFFEIPHWCTGELTLWSLKNPTDVCQIEDSSHGAVLSGIPMVPIAIGLLIEGACFFVLLVRFYYYQKLERYFTEHRYLPRFRVYAEMLLVLLGMIDLLFFAFLKTRFRIAYFLRFALGAITLKKIREGLSSFAQILYEIRVTAMLLVGLILFFAWLMAIIFDDVTGTANGEDIDAGFTPFSVALYSSFLTSTTANLPYDIIPTYQSFRSSIFLWFIMIFAGCLMLTQVILAVVYAKYSSVVKDELKQTQMERREALTKTFEHLVAAGDHDMYVSEQTFHEFCDKIEDIPGIETKDHQQETILFQWLDAMDPESPEGALSKKEFFNMTDAMLCSLCITERDSWWQRNYGNNVILRTLKRFCCSKDALEGAVEMGCSDYDGSSLERIMRGVLFLNVVLVLVESVFNLDPDTENQPGWLWVFPILDCCFAFLYLLEVGLKLLVWHWDEYWYYPSNKYDFLTSIALTCGSVAEVVWQGSSRQAYLTFLRTIRVFKALDHVRSYQKVSTCIRRMVKTCWDVLLLNFLVHYLWAALGVLLFGGKFYYDNPAFEGVLDEGDLPTVDIFNFNDMTMGLTTLFMFTLTGYFDTMAAAAFAVAQPGSFAWCLSYFFVYSFYIASVLVVFNILAAFSIDVYVKIAGDLDETRDFLAQFQGIAEDLSTQNQTVLHVAETTQLRQSLTLRSFFAKDFKKDDLAK